MNAHDFIKHQGLDLLHVNIVLFDLATKGHHTEARMMQRMSDVLQQQACIIVALLAPLPSQEKQHGPDSTV